MILIVKKLFERFTKNNFKKINKHDFKVEKVIKKKDDKLYIKWKGYDGSFSSWIDKTDIV